MRASTHPSGHCGWAASGSFIDALQASIRHRPQAAGSVEGRRVRRPQKKGFGTTAGWGRGRTRGSSSKARRHNSTPPCYCPVSKCGRQRQIGASPLLHRSCLSTCAHHIHSPRHPGRKALGSPMPINCLARVGVLIAIHPHHSQTLEFISRPQPAGPQQQPRLLQL